MYCIFTGFIWKIKLYLIWLYHTTVGFCVYKIIPFPRYYSLHSLDSYIYTNVFFYIIDFPAGKLTDMSGYIHQFIEFFGGNDIDMHVDNNWINCPSILLRIQKIFIITIFIICEFLKFFIINVIIVFL